MAQLDQYTHIVEQIPNVHRIVGRRERKLHPEIWQRGEQQFIMLPCDRFLAIQDALEDALDLGILRSARDENEDDGTPGIPMAEVLKELGLTS